MRNFMNEKIESLNSDAKDYLKGVCVLTLGFGQNF